MNLALTTRTSGEVAVVHCAGSLIFQEESANLCELIHDLVATYRKIILDLNEVEAIDGSGIGTLAQCIRTAKGTGAKLIFCRVPKKVRSLLDVTRISSLVEFATTEREALAGVAA